VKDLSVYCRFSQAHIEQGYWGDHALELRWPAPAALERQSGLDQEDKPADSCPGREQAGGGCGTQPLLAPERHHGPPVDSGTVVTASLRTTVDPSMVLTEIMCRWLYSYSRLGAERHLAIPPYPTECPAQQTPRRLPFSPRESRDWC